MSFCKTPARSFAQKLLHWSCHTGVQLTSRLSGGRGSQAVAYEMLPSAACRTPKRVAKCRSCLSLGNPLRRSPVSDGQTCGVLKCESSWPAATICGDRACRSPNMWWNVNYCGHGQPSAGRTSKHVAKWRFGEARRHDMTVNRQRLV